MTAYRTVTETPVLPWDRFPNLKRAPHIHGPSLVIHGHKDEIVPFRHGKKVYNALSQPKQLLELPHAGHKDLAKLRRKYRLELMIFSTKCLVVDFLHLPLILEYYHLSGDVLGL